ncbi:MAG TPA: TerB family tellurite resistance protein [Cytophagaceae bacterium]|jgi:tellurite resistance protein|nr:TerB family tellurite resistance protein [Cytophagaceae bacterium]
MALQNIHVALGSLAYAIAKADGVIQAEEKAVIRDLAQKEFELSDSDNEWISSMFNKLEKDNISLEDAYNYAIDTLKANQYDFDFTDTVKSKCLRFMEKVSESFDGISGDERAIIDRFKEDMNKF